jgi:hypothetical protein
LVDKVREERVIRRGRFAIACLTAWGLRAFALRRFGEAYKLV